MKASRKYCIDASGLRKLKCGMTIGQAVDAARIEAKKINRKVWIMRGMGGHLTPAGFCAVKHSDGMRVTTCEIAGRAASEFKKG